MFRRLFCILQMHAWTEYEIDASNIPPLGPNANDLAKDLWLYKMEHAPMVSICIHCKRCRYKDQKPLL